MVLCKTIAYRSLLTGMRNVNMSPCFWAPHFIKILVFILWYEGDLSTFQLQITASVPERPLRAKWALLFRLAAAVREPTLWFITELNERSFGLRSFRNEVVPCPKHYQVFSTHFEVKGPQVIGSCSHESNDDWTNAHWSEKKNSSKWRDSFKDIGYWIFLDIGWWEL